MRRKKHKQTRRATSYYRINYGFHEPYKVLLDGNFIHATKAINLGDLSIHLPKLLGGQCKLYTTKCVTRELRSMGVDFASSASAARDYPLHKCGHGEGPAAGAGHPHGEERAKGEFGEAKVAAGRGCSGGHVSAAECIRAAIGSRNEAHWFVATQDAALRQELGKIPGCPLVFATVNGIHLETPSEVTRQKAKEAEEATRSLGKHERVAQPLLRAEELEALRREQRKEATGRGGMPPPTTSARFRRNKAKGPNPLSIKKKIKKPAAPPPGAAAAVVAAAAVAAHPETKKSKRVNGGAEGPEDVAGAGGAQMGAKRRRKRAKGAAGGVDDGGASG